MSSDVILRCPNCGTSQAAPGECEACHEESVRYFCRNHTPGRWLDGPACAECVARSERERAAAATRAPAPPPIRRAPPPRDVPRSEVPRRDVPRRDVSDDDAPRWETPPIMVPPPMTSSPPPRVPPRATPRVPRPGLPPDLLPVLRSRGLSTAVGCLKRLLVLGIIIAILFALATAWFFSGVIEIGAADRVAPEATFALAGEGHLAHDEGEAQHRGSDPRQRRDVTD